jgi:hypothetical protein
MRVPEGYFTKTAAYEYIRERTGYGRLVIDNKMDELEAEGTIRFIDNPGNRQSKLISRNDVEKVVKALTVPPPQDT